MSEPDNRPDWKEIYAACRRAYDEDVARVDAADRKAHATLTLAAVLSGAGILKADSFAAVFPSGPSWVQAAWLLVVAGAVLTLGVAVFFSIRALTIRHFLGHPTPGEILSKFDEKPPEVLWRSLAEDLRGAVTKNEDVLKEKFDSLNVALCLMRPALGLCGIMLLVLVATYLTRRGTP